MSQSLLVLISKEQDYQEFWDTELILKYGTWPVFVVERLIGLFKWVSRLWPNGTLANLLRTRVPEVYIPFTNFGIFLSISFFLFINHDDWKEYNSKKIKPLTYLSQLIIMLRITKNSNTLSVIFYLNRYVLNDSVNFWLSIGP